MAIERASTTLKDPMDPMEMDSKLKYFSTFTSCALICFFYLVMGVQTSFAQTQPADPAIAPSESPAADPAADASPKAVPEASAPEDSSSPDGQQEEIDSQKEDPDPSPDTEASTDTPSPEDKSADAGQSTINQSENQSDKGASNTDKADNKETADSKDGTDKKKNLDPNRTEWSLMPMFGGNSDVGVIFGAGAVLAKFNSENDPYKWRLQLNASAAANSTGITMQRYRLRFNFPQIFHDRIRVIGHLDYTQLMDKGYYGIGNDSQYTPSSDSSRYTYGTKSPEVFTYMDVDIIESLNFLAGFRFRYSWFDTPTGSLLDEQQEYLDENGESVIPGTDDHGEIVWAVGLMYDTRDHEEAPTKGMYHQISTRVNIGPMTGTDYTWGGSTLNLRFFYSPLKGSEKRREALTLGMRLFGDMMYGKIPFYELALAAAFPYFAAIGGTQGIRGVPDGRYHGGIKILGNFEVRTVLFRPQIKSHRFKLGLAAFFDTGRVWTDWTKRPTLDGEGLGLKFGVGGGMRAQWGETFMARIDLAYSPDADPVGVYFDLGHMF